MGLYQVSSNNSPGVKFDPAPWVTSFTWDYIGKKTLEVSLYQILHVALSSGLSPRDVNYNPRVELIAKGYKFYMGLYIEIFRNLLVAKHKNYGYLM